MTYELLTKNFIFPDIESFSLENLIFYWFDENDTFFDEIEKTEKYLIDVKHIVYKININ